MKKVLIVNLKKFGDIFSSGHLINSLRQENPSCEVSILTFKESAKAAKSLKGIKDIYEIDRKRILSLKSAPLFSDVHALNELLKPLSEIRTHNWDRVINFSNDSVSTYIASFINREKR